MTRKGCAAECGTSAGISTRIWSSERSDTMYVARSGLSRMNAKRSRACSRPLHPSRRTSKTGTCVSGATDAATFKRWRS